MTRGETQFVRFPYFAARLYDRMIATRGYKNQVTEIAEYLVSKIEKGNLLDVGTGPGRLLAEVKKLNPRIEVYGLDISESMVKLAGENLRKSNIRADIRQGTIQKTSYEDDFFDIVTCTGSFYLWDDPEGSLDEIYRLLKVKCSAYLFETYKGYDKSEFQKSLASNVQGEPLLKRVISPLFLNMQLDMTYTLEEMQAIVERTQFLEKKIEKVKLGGLPIWVRIELTKG